MITSPPQKSCEIFETSQFLHDLFSSLFYIAGSCNIQSAIMLVAETGQGKLYGKTGSGKSAKETEVPGWFVGFLKSAGIKQICSLATLGMRSFACTNETCPLPIRLTLFDREVSMTAKS